jgi:hypothetical protein
VRFWHEPIRAEGLGLMRILLGVAFLSDLLLQYLPNMMVLFGPEGSAPAGMHDAWRIKRGYWTLLIFNHDDPAVLYPFFWLTVAIVFCFAIGLFSRVTNVLTWLLAMAWCARNPNVLNGGDDTLQVALLLLMLAPSGRALSVDAWLRRRFLGGDRGPAMVSPWPVRIMQIQLCLIYLTTGLVKLKGEGFSAEAWPAGSWYPVGVPDGSWWDGTSIHYIFNYPTKARWSSAQLPLPFWLTKMMTYAVVWWEVLFTPMVLWRWTRSVAVCFGVLFHLGIWVTMEIGWFSPYVLSFYAVWVPAWFWAACLDRKEEPVTSSAADSGPTRQISDASSKREASAPVSSR